ncbi:fructosamine kinase family protein [Nakamurella flavida]|uniref:Fructosamine kinase family protein n=1 Tax=Nakamurella flavida TaxID=363630 RepID=A0A938YL24_9ACTN|nr:fructosamine kinase family protein [Nakamurella flavida]MBM9474998.1 fructosamine kinase family protein [Nakamurella flavida]MDP9776567.1 fructosamine-3-kinase [Nakamurella flavida]
MSDHPSAAPEFVKTRSDAPPRFFAAEAAGLAWLAQAEGEGGAAVVGVRAVGDTSITLDRLTEATPTRAAAEDFGRALAATHAAGARAFGAAPDGWSGDAWIGRQVAPMAEHATWGTSFADLRLLPYARRAVQVGHLGAAGMAAVERVCQRLRDGEFDDDRPPARIHGDLWGGNVLFTPGGVVVIDPAAHGGHGQTDLAMLELFGCPYLDRVQAAYAEAAHLPADWPQRTGLHQLHPLLVHAASHGPSYGREVERVAVRYA